jgi:methylglutaconyl-CoA hydratase
VRAAKEAIDKGCELSLEDGLEFEAECYSRTLETSDRIEALTAFAEKRKPKYRGE